jgi:hypothetical protein
MIHRCILVFLLNAFLLLVATSLVGAESSSVVMTMMIRDEEINLNSNLPLWAKMINYFVVLVDSRTKDNSVAVITSILNKANRNFVIIPYLFEGFGQARTLSLQHAWSHYSNASHVLIADPDWKPEVSTIRLSELDQSAQVFRFTVFDRSGITRRRIDWLLLHRQGLAMRYSLHEVLDIGHYTVKEISWVAHEIEQIGTWHATVGHGNSRTAKRYEFDLELLTKDLAFYNHDPHVHYYLGITYFALAEGQLKQNGYHNATAISNAIHFLNLRLASTYDDEFVEERWACMFTLAGIYSSPLQVSSPVKFPDFYSDIEFCYINFIL